MDQLTLTAMRDKIVSATLAAERSTRCKRKGAAALATDAEMQAVIVAHNGPTHISCTAELGNCGCQHAEARLVMQLMRLTTLDQSWRPDILLTTLAPCVACAYLIAESGRFRTVLHLREYHDARGAEILRRAGLEVLSLEGRGAASAQR